MALVGRWNTSLDCTLQTAGLQWSSRDQWEPPLKIIELSGRRYVWQVLFVHNPPKCPTKVKIHICSGAHNLEDEVLDALRQTRVVQFLYPVPDFFRKRNLPQILQAEPYRNLRGLEVNFNDEEDLDPFLPSYIPSCHLDFFSFRDAPDQPSVGLLRALERNTTITNRCWDDKCRQRTGDHFRGHSFSKILCEVGGILWRDESTIITRDTYGGDLYYGARSVAIAERNRLLQQRVHASVFRVLSFARLVLRAKNSDHNLCQLPYELIETIAYWTGGGYLTEAQIKRLLKHAVNVEETKRIADLFWKLGWDDKRNGNTNSCRRLREEWLHNGGFWWDKGYDAAREYIASMDEPGYNPEAQWPDPLDSDAVFRFLAFTPSKSKEARWLYEESNDEVRAMIDACG